MRCILTLLPQAFFTASLLSTSVMAEPLVAATGPRTRTEPALHCLLGFEPKGCGKMFWGHDVEPANDCWPGDGPLQSVAYLGINAAGADVYEAQYKHSDTVYIIAPPGPDGMMGRFLVEKGNPNAIIPSSLVGVTSRTVPVLIYTRPQNLPSAGCDARITVP